GVVRMTETKPKVPPIIRDARNKPAFEYQCLTEIKNVAAGAKTFEDFDWDELARRLGEDEGPEAAKAQELAARALSEILRWLIESRNIKQAGRRAFALAWVVIPELFGGISAANVARLIRCPTYSLSAETGDFSRRFGI